MQRQSRGEPPLPEEDLSKLFKPPQPPARMESLLIAGTEGGRGNRPQEPAHLNLAPSFLKFKDFLVFVSFQVPSVLHSVVT